MHDARDEIWARAHETWYAAAYNVRIAEAMTKRWRSLDDGVRAATAVTASSSAVAGWALWNQPGYQAAWGVLAGIAALAAIVTGSLSTSSRLRDWEEARANFVGLATSLETVVAEMSTAPEFSVREYAERYRALRADYQRALVSLRADVLSTSRLARRVQRQLDTSGYWSR